MHTRLDELTDNDFAILKYLNKHNEVSEHVVFKHFKKLPIQHHLSVLSGADYPLASSYINLAPNAEYILVIKKPVYDKHHVHYSDEFFIKITELGKYALNKVKSERKSFLRRSILIPIMVAAGTDLIIHGLRWLLPLIIELASHIHK